MTIIYSLIFSLSVLLSASLLFFIQPMIGRALLPALGGTPVAWNVCLVFFQAMLLAGYFYAHCSSWILGARLQSVLHVLVLLAAAAWLLAAIAGVLPGVFPAMPPILDLPDSFAPVLSALGLLLFVVGFPFMVVSATVPVVHKWFVATGNKLSPDPYFLYGASNLGSLFALVAYPTVSSLFGLSQQEMIWLGGFIALLIALLLCVALHWMAPAFFKKEEKPPNETLEPVLEDSPRKPAILDRLHWLLLAAAPVSLLLSVTTLITNDIAPDPLFWVTPLALYLLTFVFSFAPRRILALLKVPQPVALIPFGTVVAIQPFAAFAALFVWMGPLPHGQIILQTIVFTLTFFISAWACHGMLALKRPTTRYVTEYFFWIGVGGVLGGAFTLLIAPVVFQWAYTEFALATVLCCMLRPRWLANGFSDGLLVKLFSSKGKHRERKKNTTAALVLAWLFDLGLPVIIGAFALVYCLAYPVEDVRQNLFNSFRGPSSSTMFYVVVFAPLTFLVLIVVARPLRFGLALGLVLLATVALNLDGTPDDILYQSRTSFGLFKVSSGIDNPPGPFGGPDPDRRRMPYNFLMHGTTHHGLNYHKPPNRREWGDPNRDFSRYATTYYHRKGPAGIVMEKFNWFPDRQSDNTFHADSRLPASLIGFGAAPFNFSNLPTTQLGTLWTEPPIAALGMGIGTMASYARPYQPIDFYELDPAIADLSSSAPRKVPLFHYLNDARKRGAAAKVIIGDARMQLAKHGPDGYYHAIVVDAFNSDAIPMHLLTKEAFQLYLSKLAPEGVICVHTSNRHVDLVPVVASAAENLGCAWRRGYDSAPWDNRGHFTSEWVMLARKREHLQHLRSPPGYEDAMEENNRRRGFGMGREPYWTQELASRGVLWTDDHINLLAALRYGAGGGAVIRVFEMMLGIIGVIALLWFFLEIVVGSLWQPRRRPVVLAPADDIPPASRDDAERIWRPRDGEEGIRPIQD